METAKSESLFARAVEVIPGGVNSPVRAYKKPAKRVSYSCVSGYYFAGQRSPGGTNGR